MRWIDETEIRQQQLQPDGTLLCKGVTVGRCGSQTYHASELMMDGDDFYAVHRDEAEVFDPDSMASFENKPVLMGHDGTETVGVMGNIRRRGSMLIADLWVKAKHAVDAIRRRGWRGISLGYEASYDRGPDGRLMQRRIRGEHCALLDPSTPPRCGSACMIGDQAWRRGMTRDQNGERPERLDFSGGNVGFGVHGSLESYGIGEPIELAHWPDVPATNVQVLADGRGGTRIIAWRNQEGVGYGGKPFAQQGREDQPKQAGGAALSGRPGSTTWTGGAQRGRAEDGQRRAVETYKRMQAHDTARLRQMAEANKSFWANR
jgi:hypothetical protein